MVDPPSPALQPVHRRRRGAARDRGKRILNWYPFPSSFLVQPDLLHPPWASP